MTRHNPVSDLRYDPVRDANTHCATHGTKRVNGRCADCRAEAKRELEED